MRSIDVAPDGTGTGGTKYREVANRTARLALTDATVGEIVKDLDTKTYNLLTTLPASSATNWKRIVGIFRNAVQSYTPVANAVAIDFFNLELPQVTLDCLAQTANVAVTLTPSDSFATVIEVQFGATPINLTFASAGNTILQSGGGGATVAGIANTRMLITVFYSVSLSTIYLSPTLYA
jgi:hypothetical protein